MKLRVAVDPARGLRIKDFQIIFQPRHIARPACQVCMPVILLIRSQPELLQERIKVSSALTIRSGSAFSTSIGGAAPRRAGARVPDASRGIRAEWVSISKFPMISSVQ